MPEQSTTLRDMIQEALDGGATYRQLAARAIDPITGTPVSHALLNNIVLGTRKNDTMPSQEHLRGIAVALGVPYERVRQAAISQWVPAEGESRSTRQAEQLDKLDRLQQLADELARQMKEIQDERRPEPGPSAQSA